MGSVERPKKKVHCWKKAAVHFLLCFIMGFFTGFAPTGRSSIFSGQSAPSYPSEFSPQPLEVTNQDKLQSGNFNRSLLNETPTASPVLETSESTELPRILEEEKEGAELLAPKRLIIIVTPTSGKDRLRNVLLGRLANTLRLISPPLLWIVVEQQSDSSEVSEILRKTGIMYRHLVYKENFTDPLAEMDHQRNVALKHIEHHRLSGIVHFAGLSGVYDLRFFDEIRAIEVFGTWPVAFLAANKKRVIIEGPVCDSSEVKGWHLKMKKIINLTETKPPVDISSFAFNSSILWDPERWGRPSAVKETSQNPLKFVKEEVVEEETTLKGIPSEGCSKIMLWNLHIPAASSHLPAIQSDNSRR